MDVTSSEPNFYNNSMNSSFGSTGNLNAISGTSSPAMSPAMKRQKQKQNRQRTISNAKGDFQFERRERTASTASQTARPEISQPEPAGNNISLRAKVWKRSKRIRRSGANNADEYPNNSR